MQPGGVSDIIERFIGHLHIIEEAGRDRIDYQEYYTGRVVLEPQDAAFRDAQTPTPELEETYTRSAHVKISPDFELPRHPLTPDHGDSFLSRFVQPARIVRSPDKVVDQAIGGGGGRMQAKTALYEQGGDDTIADADQINLMHDNDVFLPRPMELVHHLFDGDSADYVMALETSLREWPADMPLAYGSSNDLMDWATARTADTLPDRSDMDSAQELLSGRYINGERQPDEPTEGTQTADAGVQQSEETTQTATAQADGGTAGEDEPFSVRPELVPPVYAYGELDTGQVTLTGGNTADNVAQITDLNGAVGTMIVMGNWLETNAIVQTNVYSDHDHVTLLDGTGNAHVETGGNVADNAAELVTGNPWADLDLPQFHGRFAHVDVVDGDFYDVKAFTQTNWLQDNDITVQESYSAFYRVDTGGNEQYNGFFLHESLDYYDLIIIGGNYHSANLIFQTNIILDDDWVVAMAGGDGTGGDGQSIYTGQNWLFNNAVIRDYGVDEATATPAQLKSMAAEIAAGNEHVDMQAAWGLAGNGSQVLNVLYIDGDYFDLNYLHQVNVILDSDAAIQYRPSEASDTFTQYVSTGNNGASNQAAIVTAGAVDTLYVNGEHYEDSLLVQANIVIDEDDQVVQGTTSDLPPEIVAFTTDIEEHQATSDEPLVNPAPAYHDLLSNVVT